MKRNSVRFQQSCERNREVRSWPGPVCRVTFPRYYKNALLPDEHTPLRAVDRIPLAGEAGVEGAALHTERRRRRPPSAHRT